MALMRRALRRAALPRAALPPLHLISCIGHVRQCASGTSSVRRRLPNSQLPRPAGIVCRVDAGRARTLTLVAAILARGANCDIYGTEAKVLQGVLTCSAEPW